MKLTFYYTVIAHKNFFVVRYAVVPVCEILTFPGTFDSFSEAEKQFKKATHGKLEQLSQGAFQRKVDNLHARYRQDLAKLADWNIGKPVRI
jgi:hypothetical protein